MTRKVKVGLTLAGSFLTLIGGVFGVKALTQPPPAPAEVAQTPEKEPVREKPKEEPKPESETKTIVPEPPLRVTQISFNPKAESPAKKPAPNGDMVGAPSLLDDIQPIVPTTNQPPKPLPKTITDPEMKKPTGEPQVEPAQHLQPVGSEPAKTKTDGLGLDPVPQLDLSNKKDTVPTKPEPVKSIPSLDDFPPPAIKDGPLAKPDAGKPGSGLPDPDSLPGAGNLQLSTPPKPEGAKKDENKNGIELIQTPDPIIVMPPKKTEPKGGGSIGVEEPISLEDRAKNQEPKSAKEQPKAPPPLAFDDLPGAKKPQDDLKIDKPLDLSPPPKKEIPTIGLGGLSELDPAPAPKKEEPKSDLLPVARPVPKKAAEIPTIKMHVEPPPREAATPSREVSVPASVATLDNYDEDIHRPSSGERYSSDTAKFRALSQRYYEDESYYRALGLYNQARKTGNNSVRIPPIEVLSKLYPEEMPKPTTRGTIQTASATNVNPESKPANFETPLVNSVPYTVAGKGETLQEIAQKMLGNRDYWNAIKTLNPSVNENELVPAGTRLFLPSR